MVRLELEAHHSDLSLCENCKSRSCIDKSRLDIGSVRTEPGREMVNSVHAYNTKPYRVYYQPSNHSILNTIYTIMRVHFDRQDDRPAGGESCDWNVSKVVC